MVTSTKTSPLTFLLPKNFRAQVTVLILLLLTIVFALYAWNVSRQQKEFITDSIQDIGVALAQQLATESTEHLIQKDYATIESLLVQYVTLPNITGISVETMNGQPMSQVKVVDGEALVRYDYMGTSRTNNGENNKTKNEVFFDTSDSETKLSILEPISMGARTVGFIRLNLSLEQALQERRRMLISTLGYGLLVSFLLLTAIFLYFQKPLRAIKEASDFAAMLDERRGEKLQVSNFATEFEQLGQSLNLVSHKLLEQEEQVEASSEEAKKLALVASKTSNAVFIMNANREIEWVNAGFETMTGYRLDEIVGKRPADFRRGPDTDQNVTTYVREHLMQGKGCEAEVINYDKQGRSYWVHMTIQPIFDEQGTLQNYISIESNISERKAFETELFEAKVEAEKANLAKSEFLSRMSHELRTPLNAILGFAQILQLDDLDSEQEDSVNRILKAGKHLLALINEVLEISRIESGGVALSIESVSMKEAVDDVLRLAQPLASEFDVSLVCHECFSGDYIVSGDLQRINQVLLNLISNAIKYNRPKGTVTISCEEQQDRRLRVFVQDTGEGIEEELLDRLFVPFDRLGAEQSSIEGSGIGLALTKQLLKIMGGTIGVESTLGEGTTFWFELPISEEEHLDVTANLTTPVLTTAIDEGQANSTVVYVEDNISNIVLVEKVIARQGNIDLQIAKEGQAGLELIEELQPDLVLLDLHLPMLGGEAVLERLKANEAMKSIPVIVVSADATPKHIKRLLEKGADDYLTKPLDVHELADYVHKYLQA